MEEKFKSLAQATLDPELSRQLRTYILTNALGPCFDGEFSVIFPLDEKNTAIVGEGRQWVVPTADYLNACQKFCDHVLGKSVVRLAGRGAAALQSPNAGAPEKVMVMVPDTRVWLADEPEELVGVGGVAVSRSASERRRSVARHRGLSTRQRARA